MITIDEVAQKAGVSKSSVSRFLNGNFTYMSESMKKKITDAIEELNFTPNSLAQSLKTKKTKVIGLMLSNLSHPFWAEVLHGAQQEGMKKGFSLMITTNLNDDPDLEKENILMLRNKRVDGIIIHGTGTNFELIQQLKREGFPFILLDRTYEHIQTDAVVNDNLLGAGKVMRYLFDNDHKRIGLLSYPMKSFSPRINRLKGYKQALQERTIAVDEKLIKICDDNRTAEQALKELFALNEPPTAIFSTSILLTMEILAGLRKLKKRIPRDISVVSYEYTPWAEFVDPPLTTVVQPGYQMGAEAISLLVQRINQEISEEARVIRLSPELVVRESCSTPIRK